MNNIIQSKGIMECTKSANEKIISDAYDKELFGKAIDDALEAMEKQTPMKALEIRNRHNFSMKVIYKYGYCPCCKNEISSAYLYCNKCGKAIDWEE